MIDINAMRVAASAADARGHVLTADIMNAGADEVERLRDALNAVEMLTATGDGLDPDETMTVHLLAAEGRAHDPAAWRFDPRVVKHIHGLVQDNINSIMKQPKE